MTAVPQGEFPLALLTRRCSDGHRLSWAAALVRLHLGLSHTPDFGDGSVVLRSGWSSFLRSVLSLGETAAKAAKAELVAHGGVRLGGSRGQVVTIDGGELRARTIHRGICRLLVERLRDDADGIRLDAVAVAVFVFADLYVRARHDGDVIEGRFQITELAENLDCTRAAIRRALHRLAVNGLATLSRGRGRGVGLGPDLLHYRLAVPAVWKGVAEVLADRSSTPASVPAVPGAPCGSDATDGPACEPFATGPTDPPALHAAHGATCGTIATDDGACGLFATDPATPRPPQAPAEPQAELPAPAQQRQTAPAQGGVPLSFEVRITLQPLRVASGPGLRTNCDLPPSPAPTTQAVPRPRSRPICDRPPHPARAICAPQESAGDPDERGEGGEIPPTPPDYGIQLGIAPSIWPRLQTVLDALTTQGVRLAPTPHLAEVIGDCEPAVVLQATAGHRIEDAWDLRVVLYRRGVRRQVEGLWHDDIEATLAACDMGLRRTCVGNVTARLEWLDLFARAGLRLAGVLAVNDHLFPRQRVGDRQAPYVRFHQAAVREWVRRHATEAHLVKAPPREPPAAPVPAGRAPPRPQAIDGELLPRDLRDRVQDAALTPDELTKHRIWLRQWENTLVRLADGTVVCRYRSDLTLAHLEQLGFIARIEEAVRQTLGVTAVRSEAAMVRAPVV